MRSRKRSIWTNLFFSIMLSSLSGVVFIFLLNVLFSAVQFFVLNDIQFAWIFSWVSLVTGTFLSSYICGKYRRRNGLIEGAVCGAVIFAVVCTVSLAVVHHFPMLSKIFPALVSGASGGVFGVNSKRPRNFTDI